MGILESLSGPADLRRLAPSALDEIAREIRGVLIEHVVRNGGHLGSNLGIVELTIALHRVFDSPTDRIVFDTGHQAYVHKILTGRLDGFPRLRRRHGLSGYPSRAESEHDLVENSHASTALSYADGLAKARQLRGENGGAIVAVVGDGSLTGGMAWEAMNNIAVANDRPVVIVVNDNGRSYAPTVGGLADRLARIRLSSRYERTLRWGKELLRSTPAVGPPTYDLLHGVKEGLKDIFQSQGLFDDLGLKYVGPIDGHDIAAMESALRLARNYQGPVIVHCITEKGRGYATAEQNETDRCHVVRAAPQDPVAPNLSTEDFTDVLARELVIAGNDLPKVVAVTAAMLQPTGLAPFKARFPTRVFDVGIAEQHAVTSAAGMAMGGLHPVVCLYATFLNRAFDQVLFDVALHQCGVTFVLDRAGITGEDGPSHHGIWDICLLNLVPGLSVAAPRDARTLRDEFHEAVRMDDHPTAVRFPKGTTGADIPAVDTIAGMDLLAGAVGNDVLILSVGVMAGTALAVAERLVSHGISAAVVDPRWIKPLNPALRQVAAAGRAVVTVEDGTLAGGFGSAVAIELQSAGVPVPVYAYGVPQSFQPHGSRKEILDACHLGPNDIARDVVERFTRLDSVLDAGPVRAAQRPRRPDRSGALAKASRRDR
jgi:1-deoxy-D-xylulose-5-phosphate synthase